MIELVTETKRPGSSAPSPADAPPKNRDLTADEKREAARLGLTESDFAEIQDKRKQKQGEKK